MQSNDQLLDEARDAVTELRYNIDEALTNSNADLARQCATQLKEIGEDEEAERLLKAAKRWEFEESDFDQFRDNQ